MDTKRPAPRLYLVTPRLDDTATFARALASALSAADVAAVLLRVAEAGEREMVQRIKALAPTVQDKGVALLIEGYPDLVARSGADGAHLSGIDVLEAALPTLKP